MVALGHEHMLNHQLRLMCVRRLQVHVLILLKIPVFQPVQNFLTVSVDLLNLEDQGQSQLVVVGYEELRLKADDSLPALGLDVHDEPHRLGN